MATAHPPDDETMVKHDEEFEVFLPVMSEEDPTHVAHMRGDEVAFLDALDGFIATGSGLSAPLRSPIEGWSLDEVSNGLSGLGPAVVKSIDPL